MRRAVWSDLAIAGTVTFATLVPLVLDRAGWWIGAGVVASVPVFWWRRSVVPTALLVGAATTVLGLVGAYGETPFLLPVGMLVCSYALATFGSPPVLVTGIVVQTVGVLATLLVPDDDDFDTIRAVFAGYAAVYAIGMGVRARRAQRAAEHERERRLVEERARAVERERARIARDMHDIVTHAVGLMVVQAEAAPLVLRSDPDRAEAALEAIADTGREAISQLRGVLGQVRGTGVQGLAGIPGLVERARRAGLDVGLDEVGERRPVGAEVDVAAFRIVQEALTNTTRHARPGAAARVRVDWTAPGGLLVEVADDGGGTADLREGFGLVGMRERAAACAGDLRIDPRGFTVTATLPALPAR